MSIGPSDPNIVYSPYNWLVTESYAKTINAGASMRVMFDGTPASLVATFDLSGSGTYKPRLSFRVDKGAWFDVDMAASINLPIPTANTWGTHTVDMVFVSHTDIQERWNPQTTAVVFTGLTADTAVTTSPSRKRPLTGLAFGDSITEGMRTQQMTVWPDTLRNDSRLSHAFPLGDLLGAEMGIVGFGGTGITKVGAGGIPKFVDSIPYLWAGQARDWTEEPDFILAHIGTNDGSAADADVTTHTTGLLNYLLSVTTGTRIFVLSGWLNTKRAAMAAGIQTSTNPGRIIHLNGGGWWDNTDASDSLHPYGYVNTNDLAPRLAVAIKDSLVPAANTYICDANGNAVPLV